MKRLLLVVSVLAVGCGGKAGTDDPLTGTWTNAGCFKKTGFPDNVSECETKLTFDADLSFEFQAYEQAPSASLVTPRCKARHKISGQSWAVGIKNNAQTMVLDGTPKGTVETTDCAKDQDNKGSMVDTVTEVKSGDYVYVITGETLQISAGDLAGTYTKAKSGVF